MKKLSFLFTCGILATSMAIAQVPESIVVADWNMPPGSINSSPGDKVTYVPNIQGLFLDNSNTSSGVGKYTHIRNEWTTAEIQVGRIRERAGMEALNIPLGYYDSFSFIQYFPAEAYAPTLDNFFRMALLSDGPDYGPDDPNNNVQRENWEKQYETYMYLPREGEELMLDKWYKVEQDGIVSGRSLEMIQIGFRAGQDNPTTESGIIYFDDITFSMSLDKLTNKKACMYRENFFLYPKEYQAWSGDPNQAMNLYGTDIQAGADRWVGGLELKTSSISFEYEDGHNHYLVMNEGAPDIEINGIEIKSAIDATSVIFDISFQLDAKGTTPKIYYRLDGGEWTAVDFSKSSTIVGANWNTFTFDLSAEHVDIVDLKITSEGLTGSNFAHIDNLTIWGKDQAIPNPTAIPDIKAAANVKLSPNPVMDILYIDGEIKKAEIYNMGGQMLISGNTRQMDVSALGVGMYIVKVETPEGVFSSKIFKK